MRRVLLLGASGQVGRALQRLTPTDFALIQPASAELDLRNSNSVRQYVRMADAEIIVNCAAFTRVDDAEAEEDVAFAINARAPEAVLRSNPKACVVRTAWVHSGAGVNFVGTVVRVLRSGKSMRVVDDQVSTPTRAAHLAQFLWTLVNRREITGLQHFTDSGVDSWFDVAHCVAETLRIQRLIGEEVLLAPVDIGAFPRPAASPRMSVLDKHATWNKPGLFRFIGALV